MPDITLPADGEKPYGNKLRKAISDVNDAVDDVADIIENGRLSEAALNTAFVSVEDDCIRVLTPSFGNPGTGATIQAAIDIAAEWAVENDMDAGRSVVIQGGRYVVTEQIVHPPYVKVTTDGPVIIETQVENDSAWWITPLATDPSMLRPGYDRTQWNSGAPLSGARGGVIFTNPDETTGAVGLELGPRENLGHARRLARYRLCDLTFNGLTVAMQLNPIDHYIASYHRLMFEQNTTHVRIGDGTTTPTNSGENMTWNDCLFGTGETGFEIDAAGFHLNLANCSTDAMTRVFWHKQGRGTVRVTGGGHIENINVDNEEDGGFSVVGFTPSTGNEWPHVVISGYPPLVQNARAVQFRGQQRINVELQVRQVATDYAYSKAYLVDTEVDVARFDVAVWNDLPYVARQVNLNRDPVFAAEADDTAASALTHYNTGASGTSAKVDSGEVPYSGAKSLDIVFTGSSAYRSVTTKAFLPCKPGQTIWALAAMWVPASVAFPVVRAGIAYYDSEGAQIGSTAVGFVNYGTTPTREAWIAPKFAPRHIAPAGATKFKVTWTWTIDSGADGSSVYHVSDLFAIAANA